MKEKLTQYEFDRLEILEEFKLRMEFKQRVNRITEMYIDYCDDEETEPTQSGFISFIMDNDG